jgi:NodT family efflux transporter outer membrane factor (OMF) lipoprotein
MKMNKKLIFSIVGNCLLTGCFLPTVGPDYERSEITASEASLKAPGAGWPMTTNLTETGEYKPADESNDPRALLKADDIRRWWRQFDDEILSSLVENAVSNNRSFLMAQQRLVQARWRYTGSWSDLMPQFDIGGKATRSYAGKNGPSGRYRRGTFRAGFDAAWEIDLFGGVRRGVEEAEARMEMANCDLADAWVSLSSEIGSLYVELRTVQQRTQVARANLKLQTETYDILKSRLDSGIGDELAVNQAKYNVDQTHATIPTLLMQEEELMNSLAILAGTMPGALHEQLKACPDRDWLVEPKRLESIPLDVMRSRPDVRAAEYALMAQVAHVGVAKSLLFPKFYINGTLGLESVNAQKFFRRDSLYSSLGPSFSWPIFQGGALYANLRAEEAAMDEAALKYEFVMQNAFGEIRTAYSAYTQEYHRYEALKGAVQAAKDAENISQDLYKNGLADFNNVLDAQRSLLALEESLTISRGKISQDLVKLYKSLGGGISM